MDLEKIGMRLVTLVLAAAAAVGCASAAGCGGSSTSPNSGGGTQSGGGGGASTTPPTTSNDGGSGGSGGRGGSTANGGGGEGGSGGQGTGGEAGHGGHGGEGGHGGASASSSNAASSSASTAASSSASSSASSAASSSTSASSSSSTGGGPSAKLYTVVYDPVAQLENIATIDPVTHKLTSIGTLPANYQWFDLAFVSPEQGRIYVRSEVVGSNDALLTIDVASGTLVSATIPTVAAPLAANSLWEIGANAAGAVRAMAWDPNVPVEHVLDVNPSTGVTTDLGTLPTTYQAFNASVVDHPADRFYVQSDDTLLTLGTTGALLGAAPISLGAIPTLNFNLLAANGGALFGFAWDAGLQRERVVKLNPATGVGVGVDSLPASVTTLSTYAGYTTIDAAADEILVLDEATTAKIFTLRASTGAYLGQTELDMNGFINPLVLFSH